MNLDVARAIPQLVAAGTLTPEQGAAALRPAAGELATLRGELRALLYLGVLAVTAGVGVLIKENLDRIGPTTIAIAIAVAAAGVLFWVEREAAPFSWSSTPSPHLAWDYFLLLGMLLLAADLAFIEAKFTPLGPNWTYHLLLVAILYAVAAVRYDARTLFSLALSTFAAWRGVAAAKLGAMGSSSATVLRWNAIACGALFLLLGWLLHRLRRKAHFEPVATWLGWLLVLGALATGMAAESEWPYWALPLFLLGGGLAVGAVRRRRFGLFALGLLAAYAALSRAVLDLTDAEELGCLWFFATSILLLVALIVAATRFRRKA